MYFDEHGEVHIEEDDQCFSCEHFLKGVKCPLLEALAEKVVFLDGDVTVRNCGFYKKFQRHLRVLPVQHEDQDTGELAVGDPEMPSGQEFQGGELHRIDEAGRRSI